MLTYIFSRCDDDHDGKLSMKEYTQLSQKQDDSSIKMQIAVFQMVDANQDGIVTIQEFKDHNMQVGGTLDDISFYAQANAWLKLATVRDVK